MRETCVTRGLVLPQASGSGKGCYLTKWYDLSDGIDSKTARSWEEEKMYYNPSGNLGKTESSGVNQLPERKLTQLGFMPGTCPEYFGTLQLPVRTTWCNSDTTVSPVFLVSSTIVFMFGQHIPIWWLYNGVNVVYSYCDSDTPLWVIAIICQHVRLKWRQCGGRGRMIVLILYMIYYGEVGKQTRRCI